MAHAAAYLAQNPAVAVAALGVAVLAAFYGAVWFLVGRDPPRGTIVPLFAPPDGMSPEAVRYLHAMAWDRKAFAAALIATAVKGFLTIQEKDAQYTLTRTGKSAAQAGLSPGETAMCEALFANAHKTLELKPYHARDVQAAIDALQDSLLKQSARYFTANDGAWWSGIGMFALTAAAATYFTADPWGTAFDSAFLGIMIFVTIGILRGTANMWRTAFHAPHLGRFVEAVLCTLLVVPFALLVLAMVHGFGETISYPVFGTLLAGAALIVLFRRLLKAPTPLGAATRDKIDGFKMYLQTAEQNRLETLTPEVFEACLPYAIALDCETSWSRAFEAQMVPDAPRHHLYTPLWYAGSVSALSALGSVGANLGSAVAAASVAPVTHHVGTFGGIGGAMVSGLVGGFSGGGRGGGGGGGW
jgi:hypothetical protein